MPESHFLGLCCNVHDSAAALISGGVPVAAAQEERFTREKHSGAFPENAIRYCLSQARLDIQDISAVGFYWQPWRGLLDRAALLIRGAPHTLCFSQPATLSRGTPKTLIDHFSVPHRLAEIFGYKGEFRFLPHSRCHASSTFYLSRFEDSAILCIDLAGEIDSTFAGVGEGSKIAQLWTVAYPHSLGSFYGTITQFLGYSPNSHEYRVMGLAAYGRPTYYKQLRQLIELRPHGQFRLNLNYFVRHWGHALWYSKRLVDLLGPPRSIERLDQRYADIACSAQAVLEEAVLHLVRELRVRSAKPRLCLAGGVALNAVMNHRIRSAGIFEELYVPPAPHDAGTSVGAALLLWHEQFGTRERQVIADAYWGPEYVEEEIESALQSAGVAYERMSDPEAQAAAYVAQGRVVGWFQGRMEFGPRALGNRSILADPRDPTIRKIVNQRVKSRELYRPFGASVPIEFAPDYFDLASPSPFMLEVCRVLPKRQSELQAITHVDGTCRPHTVERRTNERYWRLLLELKRLTGHPVALNTSFNIAGEPIVCSPTDAVRCFMRSGIDVLIIGPYAAKKENGGETRCLERAIESELGIEFDPDRLTGFA